MVFSFMLNLGLSFFFKTLQIQIIQLHTGSGSTLFSSLLVNTCSLITDKNLGEIQCIVYKIIQSIISQEMHHTFKHVHTSTHNLWFWPKRPPLAFSVAETSVAEMSGPKRPRPKCPWPKCPTFVPGHSSWVRCTINRSHSTPCKMAEFEHLQFFPGHCLDLFLSVSGKICHSPIKKVKRQPTLIISFSQHSPFFGEQSKNPG